MDKTCKECACNKVCNHDVYGFESCGNFIKKEKALKECEYK